MAATFGTRAWLTRDLPEGIVTRANRGIWDRIEERIRRMALFYGEVFVVTGPGSPAPRGDLTRQCPGA